MGQLKKKILKKVKGSSLVETMVASVVIMVVFGISMATISNILRSAVEGNTRLIDRELNKIEYFYKHGKVQVPNTIDFKDWEIEVKKEKYQDGSFVVLKAKNTNTNKERKRKFLE